MYLIKPDEVVPLITDRPPLWSVHPVSVKLNLNTICKTQVYISGDCNTGWEKERGEAKDKEDVLILLNYQISRPPYSHTAPSLSAAAFHSLFFTGPQLPLPTGTNSAVLNY